MGQYTTDEVYDRLAEVKQQLEKTVTTAHFDAKVAELKTAIEQGGKKPEEKKDEPKGIMDIIKGLPLVKQALDLFQQLMSALHSANPIAQLAAISALVGGALAFYRTIRDKITGIVTRVKGILTAFKEATLKFTGRFLGNRQFIGRNDEGKLRLRPERTPGEMQRAVRESSRRVRRGGRAGGASGGSGAGDVRDLGQALGRVNGQAEAFDRLKSKLPSAASMKRTARAADKLSGALGKVAERLRPAELDELSAATGRLNQKIQALDHEKLPRTLHAVSDAARELNRNAQQVRTMFRDLATSATDAANAIA
ncbi:MULTISPECIES: hypothetical protein [unclassified Streptomyces]|uniref:hypothetical protein n=1 Tax=unclassified Streptomyces TaxID=2593676 RepID=UPI00331F0D13